MTVGATIGRPRYKTKIKFMGDTYRKAVCESVSPIIVIESYPIYKFPAFRGRR